MPAAGSVLCAGQRRGARGRRGAALRSGGRAGRTGPRMACTGPCMHARLLAHVCVYVWAAVKAACVMPPLGPEGHWGGSRLAATYIQLSHKCECMAWHAACVRGCYARRRVCAAGCLSPPAPLRPAPRVPLVLCAALLLHRTRRCRRRNRRRARPIVVRQRGPAQAGALGL